MILELIELVNFTRNVGDGVVWVRRRIVARKQVIIPLSGVSTTYTSTTATLTVEPPPGSVSVEIVPPSAQIRLWGSSWER
jgi:hypothetical protein